MEPLIIGIGGALGAVSRYGIGLMLGSPRFPWATLSVNALGSLFLGIVIFGVSSSDLFLLLGVGFCGAFTTFSTFSFQTVGLWQQEEYVWAVLNAFGNLFVSLLAFIGAWIILA